MNIALVLSGGTGERLGSEIPKQYITVSNKPIFLYCIETISNHPMIDKVQIVAAELWYDFIRSKITSDKFMGFSKSGDTRQLSVYNGLTDILKYANDDDYLFIHDAVRPLLSYDLITGCIVVAQKHEGALPVIPMKDTMYLRGDEVNTPSLVDRSKVFAGQAPEVFKLGKYYKANSDLLPDKIRSINGSAEPAIMAGMDIVMIPGDENNFKITTKDDLERFKDIARRRGGILI